MSDAASSAPTNPAPAEPQAAAPVESLGPLSPEAGQAPRLRLWPGVAIVATQGIAVMLTKQFAPGTVYLFYAMFMGPMIAAGAFAVWWLFASRLPWRDRWLIL